MKTDVLMFVFSVITNCNLETVNLAFRRPTYQAKPFSRNVSYLAVDGDISTCAMLVVDPYYYDARIVASWSVQLEQVYDIKNVIIAYDLHSPYLNDLNNFIIYVSIDSQQYINCVQFDNMTIIYGRWFLNLSCEENAVGNTVHIVKNGGPNLNRFTFCEVYIYGEVNHDIITLAYKRQTEQSGLIFSELSPSAVDGKLETCTRIRASINKKAWWSVTLNDTYTISNISIHFNPNDYEVHYLNNFNVYVSNDKDNFEQQFCASFEGNVSATDRYINLTCVQRVTGIYVTIKKFGGSKPEWLYFCEVYIYPKGNDGDCIAGAVPCKSDLRCIPIEKICDRVKNCDDGSDELNCGCFSYQFACNIGLCIPQDWTCDGTKDCPNGDDEDVPMLCSCSKNEFKCLKHLQCIPITRVCDGVIHCNDSSDEIHCLRFENQSLNSNLIKATFQGEDNFYICSIHWNTLIGFRVCKHMGRSFVVGSKYLRMHTPKIVTIEPNRIYVKGNVPIMYLFKKSTYCESGHIVSLECSPFSYDGCGTRGIDETNLPYIINGDIAQPGAWPWHAQVIIDQYKSCGGSVMNNNWILTAAHCVEDIRNTSQISIKVGTNVHHDPNVMSYSIVRFVLHPNYSKVDYDDDIALIQTSTRIRLGILTVPICLPDKFYDDDKLMRYRYCIATGFGRTDRDVQIRFPTNLRQGRLNLMSNEECLRNLLSDSTFEEKIINDTLRTNKFICAGSMPTTYGVTICKGDSGGPLVCKDEHGIWTQIGIMRSFFSSKSNIICTNNIFMRVDYYISFIKNILYYYK